METPPSKAPTLDRGLSLLLITGYGLGTIIGAGIYVLVGEVAGLAGMGAPLAFLLAAALAAPSALSFAELSARYPRSAGEALYVHAAFGRVWLSRLVGLLVLAVGMVVAATLSRGFVGYFQVFVPSAPAPAVIAVLVLALGALAAWGIRASVWLVTAMTLVEVGGLVLIVAVAADNLATLPARLPELLTVSGAWPGLLAGAFLAFFAFIGFEDMVNVAEEVRDPRRNLPLGIVLALLVTAALYLLVALVAVLGLPLGELAASAAPLALLWERSTGQAPALIAAVSLFAVVNGAMVQMIMASRVLYGLSRLGWLPAFLGRVDPRTRTPLGATGLVIAVVLVLALWIPLVWLANGVSFIVLIIFTLVNLALLRVKRRDPAPPGVPRIPAWVPVLGCVASIAVVIRQLFVWL